MWHQSSVETGHALFLGDESEALHQAGVFGDAVFHGCLAESCADDLFKTQSVQFPVSLLGG